MHDLLTWPRPMDEFFDRVRRHWAITQAVCENFKTAVLKAVHDFTAASTVFKLALFASSATLNASTTNFTPGTDITGTGYTTGGTLLTSITPALAATATGNTGVVDFNDCQWLVSTITARGALIYNDVSSNDQAVQVLDFSSDKTSTGGTFTIQFPAATATAAILRLT